MREVWNPGWAPVTPFAKCWPLSGNSQNVRLSMQKDLCILRLEEWSKGVKHWHDMFWTPPQPTSGKAWLLSPKHNGGSRQVDGPFNDVKMLTKVNGLERVVLGAAAPAASILLALSCSRGRFCSVPNFCVHYPSLSQAQPPHRLSSQLWTDPQTPARCLLLPGCPQ